MKTSIWIGYRDAVKSKETMSISYWMDQELKARLFALEWQTLSAKTSRGTPASMQRSRSLEHQRWHKQQAEKSSSHLWPVQCTLILAVVKCTGLMQKHVFQSSVKCKRSYWFGLNQEALEPPETVHCLLACFLQKKSNKSKQKAIKQTQPSW